MQTVKITSSGIIRNAETPRVGVMSAHNLADWVLNDLYADAIDLTFEEFDAELQEQVENGIITEDEAQESREFAEFDSHVFLFGDWIKDESGQYQIDRNGGSGFSAVYDTGTGNVSVEYSKHVKPCHHTSPCYVMADGSGPCGDLDTDGNSVIAYTLPADYLKTEE